MYLVLGGKAVFRAGGREQSVAPGSVIFVERAAEHRFVDVTEGLTVLVFFAPPEGSLKEGISPCPFWIRGNGFYWRRECFWRSSPSHG